MKSIPLYFFSLLLLGCSSTSLVYKDEILHIKNSYTKQYLKGKTLFTDQANYGTIFIDQKVFQSSHNEILVYEHATLDTGYNFKYNYSYTLSHIFNAKKVKSIKNREGLGFYRIHLKNDAYIYALVKTGTKRSLTMVYGFCEENFNALLHDAPLRNQNINFKSAHDHITSQWNMQLIITGTLLEKKGRKFHHRE